jgi:hypothetical protein
VRDLRAAGWAPGRVLGAAAHAAGLIERPRPLDIDELPEILTATR